MDKYRVVRTCGEGTFAIVYEAHHTADGSHVAIKKIKEPAPSWEACMQMRELRAFKTVGRHPNIVGLKELVLERGSLNFVFEFLSCNLHEVIQSSPAPFDEGTVARMTRDMLLGLAHLHAKGFMHRDLKPENVLCDEVGSVLKLGDLGLAREIRSRPPHTDYVATRWYRAPELCLRSTTYSSPVDTWAVGCMVCELYTRQALLPGGSDVDMLHRMSSLLGPFSRDSWPEGEQLANRARIRLPPTQATPLRSTVPDASPSALALLSEMFAWDPRKRPSCHTALAHDFITKAPPPEANTGRQPVAAAGGAAISAAERPRRRGSQVDAPRWLENRKVQRGAQASDEEGLRQLFDQFDADGTGTIDQIELRLLLAYEGLSRDAHELLATLDRNGSGAVEFDELALWWANRHADADSGAGEKGGAAARRDAGAAMASGTPADDAINAAIGVMFAHYDADSSGQISLSELIPLLQERTAATTLPTSSPLAAPTPAPFPLRSRSIPALSQTAFPS